MLSLFLFSHLEIVTIITTHTFVEWLLYENSQIMAPLNRDALCDILIGEKHSKYLLIDVTDISAGKYLTLAARISQPIVHADRKI